MANFYSPTSQTLFDDVLWLPQKGARTILAGRPPNAYAILARDGAILVDAVFSWNLPGVEEMAHAGKDILGVVITCAHVVEHADALETLRHDFGCRFLLHPADQASPAAERTGLVFEDPLSDGVLTKAGVDVIPMPHHTPGSIMLHMEDHRGTLFSGASAVAPGPLQEPEPPRLERPVVGRDGDGAFREQWEVLCAQRKYSNILPLFGTPYTDRTDTHQIMRQLWDGTPLDERDAREDARGRERAEGVHV